MDVTVVVATFGDSSWVDLAEQRAIPSAEALRVPVIHSHGTTLDDARNHGLRLVDTEWVVHLDADDELEPGYIDVLGGGTADVRAPAVRYVRNGKLRFPSMPRVAGHVHACSADCLPEGNWLVVGSAVRADLARSVGGWRPFEWSEDWDLWLRCHLARATFEAMPDAVYRAHVRPDSRNRSPEHDMKMRVHREIHQANFPHLYEAAPA